MARVSKQDNQRKVSPTPKQVEYLIDKLSARLGEFRFCLDQMAELDIDKLDISNWASGSNGLSLLSNLSVEMTKEVHRISDARALGVEVKPKRKRTSKTAKAD
jgi:hypothetical protein